MAPALALLLAFSAALAACGQVLLKVGANGRASLAAFANGWIAR